MGRGEVGRKFLIRDVSAPRCQRLRQRSRSFGCRSIGTSGLESRVAEMQLLTAVWGEMHNDECQGDGFGVMRLLRSGSQFQDSESFEEYWNYSQLGVIFVRVTIRSNFLRLYFLELSIMDYKGYTNWFAKGIFVVNKYLWRGNHVELVEKFDYILLQVRALTIWYDSSTRWLSKALLGLSRIIKKVRPQYSFCQSSPKLMIDLQPRNAYHKRVL